MKTIAASALKPRLTSGAEIAFLDVREAGQYGEGHPFFSVNVAYSRLEHDVVALVPRRQTPVVLLDDGDGVAERAARRLAALGYGDVSVLEGGAAGWTRAGCTLFKGVNVPSKAFGEIVEHELHVPSLSAEELVERRARGDKLVVLDGRTATEYRRMTIPGSRHCPNAELPHRIGALVPDPDATIVVNCAGRTRSIIGAQNLRNLGLPNPIIALRNGTQGWLLAGLELERGTRPADLPGLDAAAEVLSRERARQLIARQALPTIDPAGLERWRAESSRTLYLLDVRTDGEFAAGHLPGSVHAPGGQVAQATDQWIATRGARIVLVDDTGLRAATTASWLRGMGHDATVLAADVRTLPGLQRGAPSAISSGMLPLIAPAEAKAALARGAQLLDLNPSMTHRRGHVRGARWTIRPRIAGLSALAGSSVIVVSDDPVIADLAAIDLREAGVREVHRLSGTPAEWTAAGLPVVATPQSPADAECIDYLFFVHDRHDGNLDAARGYLAWEVGLLDQMDEQETSVLRPLR